MKRLFVSFLIIINIFCAYIIYAAPPSRIYTYTSGGTIQPSENTANEDAIFNYLNRGVDTYADSTITTDDVLDGTLANIDISGTAAIADTKLAQITTASKVSATAITGLASTPSGAGIIPSVNLPGGGITLPAGSVFFMITGSCPTGSTDVSATYSDKFIRINATAGSTGGADTHGHSMNFPSASGGGNQLVATGGLDAAAINHTHQVNGDTTTTSNVPGYVTAKLCQVN